MSFTVGAAAGTPTGSVTVSDGVDTCNGALLEGVGSCSLLLTTEGIRTLTASYLGEGDFSASSGTETHAVEDAPPATASALSVSPVQ